MQELKTCSAAPADEDKVDGPSQKQVSTAATEKHRDNVCDSASNFEATEADIEADSGPLQFHFLLPRNAQCQKSMAQESWPLIIYLHGSHLRGKPLSHMLLGPDHEDSLLWWINENMFSDDDAWHGPCRYCIDSQRLPCAVFAPKVNASQHGGFRSQFEEIWAKIDELAKEFPLDMNRVYVTGVSMGGTSTWEMGLKYPERIAALAPVCGAGLTRAQGFLGGEAAKLAKLGMPVWIFHGDKDTIVLPSDAKLMHDEMVKGGATMGSQLRFSLVPGVDHEDIDDFAYKEPEFYKWLTNHSLQTRRVGKSLSEQCYMGIYTGIRSLFSQLWR